MTFVDMVIKDKKLVIEIDGPYHYLMNNSKKMIVKDQLKRNIIEARGYKIETINVDNFNLMRNEEKQQLFSNILKVINSL